MARQQEFDVAHTARRWYLKTLTLSFTVFGSARVIAHLPTIWAILLTGDASQHSVWTWLTWVGANGTMAAALHEQNGQRIDRAIVVNLGNTAMCLATTALIVYSRYLGTTGAEATVARKDSAIGFADGQPVASTHAR